MSEPAGARVPFRGRRIADPVALPGVEPGVALWWTDLAHDADDLAHAYSWLAAAEHARAARFGTDRLRRKYIAGRVSLRQVLGEVLGTAPAAVPIRRGARGRPELDIPERSLDFNISHTEGGAIIGVVRGLPDTRIGVDIERQDRALCADRLARKFLSAAERETLQGLAPNARRLRFLRYWTCKEAMSKATGDGIAARFARLTVAIGSTPPILVAGPPPYVPEAWRLHAPKVPAGFIAAVALWHADAAEALQRAQQHL